MENTQDRVQDKTVDRRRLLRRAGTVAVGVAGAGVAGAVVATPAEAASGAFDSNTLNGPAVTAVNPATGSESGVPTIGPQVQLTPNAGGWVISEQAPKGSIAMDGDGYLWVVSEKTVDYTYRDFIHTTGNSNLTVPISPVRILDTDTSKLPGGTDRILNPSGAFNGNKLKSSKWVFLDLTDLVQYGLGVICTVVVVAPGSGGYISVGPYVGRTPPKPDWSSINYNAGLTTSGLVFSGIGGEVDAADITTDVIAIYSNQEVRVLIDISGFVVDSAGRVGGTGGTGLLPDGQGFAAARRAQIARHAPKV